MIIGQLDYLWPRASFRKGREVKLGARPRAREKEGEACPPSSFLARPSCFPRAHILFPFPLTDYLSNSGEKNGMFLLVTLRSLSNLLIMFIAPLVYVFHFSGVCFNVLLKLSMRDNVLRFVQMLSIIFS